MSLDKKTFRGITAKFDEVKILLDQHEKLKTEIKKIDRKLKTVEAKYSFISNVIGVGANDDLLASEVKRLFKNTGGFSKIEHLKSKAIKPKREDLRLWTENELFVVEVKGISRSNPKAADISQVRRYLDWHLTNTKVVEVYGLTIINHQNNLPLSERKFNFGDSENQMDAINGKYGFVSAIQLVFGFLDLKNDFITFDGFKNKLKQYGRIEFKK